MVLSWMKAGPTAVHASFPLKRVLSFQNLARGAALAMALFSLSSCNVDDLLGQVELSATASTVQVGGTLQVVATFLSPGTTQVVTTTALWRSDDINIASVEAGVVTGRSLGMTTIFAKYNDIEGSLDIFVMPSSTVETLTLNTSGFSIGLGGIYPLISTSNLLGDVSSSTFWVSADSAVASVDGQGLVTGMGLGTARITAFYNSLTAWADATVTDLATATLTSITVTPASSTVDAGATVQYIATGTYSDSSTADLTTSVAWSSSNATDVSHNGGGNFTGNTPNALVTITATESGTAISGTASLTVNNQLVSIGVTPNTPTVTNGWRAKFTATGVYADSFTADLTSSATWSSANTAIAYHQNGGVFFFGGTVEGTVNITATDPGTGISDSTTLTVNNPLVGITVDPLPGPQPQPGTRQQLRATGTFFDSSTKNLTPAVSWSSSDPGVATIEPNSGGMRIIAAGVTDLTGSLAQFSSTLPADIPPLTLGETDLIVELALVSDNQNGMFDIVYTIVNVGDTALPSQTFSVDFFENETIAPSTGVAGNGQNLVVLALAPGQASGTQTYTYTPSTGVTAGNMYAVVDTSNTLGNADISNNVSGALPWGAGSPNAIYLEAFPNNSSTAGTEDTYFQVFASDGVTLLGWNGDHILYGTLFSGLQIYMQPGKVPFLRVTPFNSSTVGGYSLWAATNIYGFTGASTGTVVDPDGFEPDDTRGSSTFLKFNMAQDHYMENGEDWYRFMIPGGP